MIKGIGIDIVDISRFLEKDEVKLDKMAERILTETEHDIYNQLDRWYKPEYLAKHWSVKESVAKAFGTGFRQDVTYKNIELYHNDLGAPGITLHNELSDNHCHISISHDGGLVISYALLQ